MWDDPESLNGGESFGQGGKKPQEKRLKNVFNDMEKRRI